MNKKEIDEESIHTFVKWFSELTGWDSAIAGNKGASLAGLYNLGFPVPQGFIITTQAYQYFIEQNNIAKVITALLNEIKGGDDVSCVSISKKIRALFHKTEMPKPLCEEILEAYDFISFDQNKIEQEKIGALALLGQASEPRLVAIRSSIVHTGMEEKYSSGQYEYFLNVRGKKYLLEKVKACFSSLFTQKALSLHIKKELGFDEYKMAVIVQKMISNDVKGIIFSQIPSNAEGRMSIEVNKSRENACEHYIIDRDLSNFTIIESSLSGGEGALKKKSMLSPYEIKMLALHAQNIEARLGKPQEITFTKSGKDIYFLQSYAIIMPPQESFIGHDEIKKEISADTADNLEHLYQLAVSELYEGEQKNKSEDMEEIILKALGDEAQK